MSLGGRPFPAAGAAVTRRPVPAHGRGTGEDDGTAVRTDRYATGGRLLRAGDTWVVVNGDGTNGPPLLGLRQGMRKGRRDRVPPPLTASYDYP
ncbi:hypothetical protein FB157_11952 [Streptomyces sp. BK340]|nr:hypothetical protein FB157_11952 [Streptomyces sp. BK340]